MVARAISAEISQRMVRIPNKLDVGQALPNYTLTRYIAGTTNRENFETLRQIEGLAKVLIRTVVGAWTPTCHGTDMADLKQNLPELLKKYDLIVVLSSDNCDVMRMWQKTLGLEDPKVQFWADNDPMVDPNIRLIDHFVSLNCSGDRGLAYCYQRGAYEFSKGLLTNKSIEKDAKNTEMTCAKNFTHPTGFKNSV